MMWRWRLLCARHCARHFTSMTQFCPRNNSGRIQDHLPFTVKKLRLKETISFQTSQGYEEKQLRQDPKLGPSHSKAYLFQNIPISTKKTKEQRDGYEALGPRCTHHRQPSPFWQRMGADSQVDLRCMGMHFILSVLGRLKSSKKLLSNSRLWFVGKAGTMGCKGNIKSSDPWGSPTHSLYLEWWSYLIL